MSDIGPSWPSCLCMHTEFKIRPKKKCLFPVTGSKKRGSVGRDFFFIIIYFITFLPLDHNKRFFLQCVMSFPGTLPMFCSVMLFSRWKKNKIKKKYYLKKIIFYFWHIKKYGRGVKRTVGRVTGNKHVF